MEVYPLVSVITVNYNQSIVTSRLIESLLMLSYPNIEIIIVDNGSEKESSSWLKEKYPSVIYIRSDENRGFAGGNNLGSRNASGEFFFYLNNDTEVPSGFLEPLVRFMLENASAGMVSPKIKYYQHPNIIQYAGFTKMSSFTVRNSAIGYKSEDNGDFDAIMETHSIHGAAMMIRRELFESVGPMPEIYFLYYEEHDWAQMAKLAGYKLFYHPGSYILHKESISTGKNTPLKTYYINRGRLIYTIRNYKSWKLALSLIFQIFVSLPKNTFLYLCKRETANMKAYHMAYSWIAHNYKTIIKTRYNP